jgi:hypothetical protein
MQKGFAWLIAAAVCFGGYSYYRDHYSSPKKPVSQDVPETETEAKPDLPGSDKAVTVAGPLAEWMDKVNPLHKDPPPRKPHPSDHIAPSPVGTSSAIVHKTFSVTAAAKFPFEIPAHAASPQLHGTYRSFVQQAGVQSSDEGADIDLLLMNERQYADYLHGHPADTVYSVDSSHDQDINFGLPATLDHPVQYYLLFRNSSSAAGKKIVQADFRVDF